MRAWNNIQASNGVFQNEFVLPDKSDLGRWTIIAKWDGQVSNNNLIHCWIYVHLWDIQLLDGSSLHFDIINRS